MPSEKYCFPAQKIRHLPYCIVTTIYEKNWLYTSNSLLGLTRLTFSRGEFRKSGRSVWINESRERVIEMLTRQEINKVTRRSFLGRVGGAPYRFGFRCSKYLNGGGEVGGKTGTEIEREGDD